MSTSESTEMQAITRFTERLPNNGHITCNHQRSYGIIISTSLVSGCRSTVRSRRRVRREVDRNKRYRVCLITLKVICVFRYRVGMRTKSANSISIFSLNHFLSRRIILFATYTVHTLAKTMGCEVNPFF